MRPPSDPPPFIEDESLVPPPVSYVMPRRYRGPPHRRAPTGSCMKRIGGLLIVLGVIGLLIGSTMDVSVEVYSEYSAASHRVNNIGLIEDRRNCFLLSSLAVVSGIMLVGFGSLRSIATHR